MLITLEPDLESALNNAAHKQGIAPEDLALSVLRQRFLSRDIQMHPRDEWERELLGAATDCGTSLSNEDVSSEGLYE